MNLKFVTSRKEKNLSFTFSKYEIKDSGYVYQKLIGIASPYRSIPLIDELRNNDEFLSFVKESKQDVLLFEVGDDVALVGEDLSDNIKHIIKDAVFKLKDYGGTLLDDGSLLINLKDPEVGPHYAINLLLGDRSKFNDPLLTTPKSVLDSLGRGSFRGPAGYQILASKWDILPEENGNPFNRQFYLIEKGKIIFYSARISDDVLEATCLHEVNQTTIKYKLKNGLEIERRFFLPKQKDGQPEAMEIQEVNILSNEDRDIEICFTGMFGFSNPDCMQNDVIYQTIIQEGSLVQNDKNEVVAISPNYYPVYFKDKVRFFSFKDEDGFPNEFTMDEPLFVGNGSISNPNGVFHLDNRLKRKGASFFALKKKISLKKNETYHSYSYTGLVNYDNEDSLKDKLLRFLNENSTYEDIENLRKERIKSFEKYSSSFVVKTDDTNFNSLISKNLPFQNLYQTFVSRSFAQTQKGYREIGFREVQDLYSSMPYMIANGEKDLAKSLLLNWVKNVYTFGYANHNFYFEGKERGMCSDDALWLIIALTEYIELTGDKTILEEEVVTADKESKRKIKDTIKAIVNYSTYISIGKHGLPLLDMADWNDCLKIDGSVALSGSEKEILYRRQIEEGMIKEGDPLLSSQSESVMNAFLLLTGLNRIITTLDGDLSYYEKARNTLKKRIISSSWINGYFARVLVNREGAYTSFVGSLGDGLSKNKELDNGSIFLNSFSWSVLSGAANEEMISSMLEKIDTHLKTCVGFRLVSEEDLTLLGCKDTATSHYFPGDRENGGVFKHAGMMFVESLFVAAKKVKDIKLKERLLDDAFFMLEQTYPYRSLLSPYIKKGNPRFCTQYANPYSKEDVGPMLSGTATWMIICIKEMLGISFLNANDDMSLLLPKEMENIRYSYKLKESLIDVSIKKEKGRYAFSIDKIKLDGQDISSISLASLSDKNHSIEILMK